MSADKIQELRQQIEALLAKIAHHREAMRGRELVTNMGLIFESVSFKRQALQLNEKLEKLGGESYLEKILDA